MLQEKRGHGRGELEQISALRHARPANGKHLGDLSLGADALTSQAISISLALNDGADPLQEVPVVLALALGDNSQMDQLGRFLPGHEDGLAPASGPVIRS